MRVEEADGDDRELLFFKGVVGEDAVDELEVEGEAAAEDLAGADHVVHHDGGLLGEVARARGVHVVQVDVPGDAVALHGRDVRGPAAATHGGAWWHAVTHGRSSLKRREIYKRRRACVDEKLG